MIINGPTSTQRRMNNCENEKYSLSSARAYRSDDCVRRTVRAGRRESSVVTIRRRASPPVEGVFLAGMITTYDHPPALCVSVSLII